MRRYCWYLLLLPLVLTVCTSPPETVKEAPIATAPNKEEPGSDSVLVSQEVYDHTLTEVKLFVDSLNTIIRNKNYSGWRNALSDRLFAHISSPEFLGNASESNLLRSKKIVLKTPGDYFTNVVVPSRSNSQVDEIEFTVKGTVKVYYLERLEKKSNSGAVTVEVRRLRLYELEKSGDTWKIID